MSFPMQRNVYYNVYKFIYSFLNDMRMLIILNTGYMVPGLNVA